MQTPASLLFNYHMCMLILNDFDLQNGGETNMNDLRYVIRTVIKELKSPVGDSREELSSGIQGIIDSLDNMSDDLFNDRPTTSIMTREFARELRHNKMSEPRAIAAILSKLLNAIRSDLDDETLGLQMRIETLLRRMPQTGIYNVNQSPLNPPFDPSKAGRFNTT